MAPEIIQEIIDDGLAVDEQELCEKLTPLYQIIKWMTKPTIIGRENLPDKPVLFVANHATLAVDGFFCCAGVAARIWPLCTSYGR